MAAAISVTVQRTARVLHAPDALSRRAGQAAQLAAHDARKGTHRCQSSPTRSQAAQLAAHDTRKGTHRCQCSPTRSQAAQLAAHDTRKGTHRCQFSAGR